MELALPGTGNRPTVRGVPIRINKKSAMPTYLQLASELRRLIAEGDLAPGDRLPSLYELVESTGLSHSTIQRAVGLLKEEGAVVSAPGRGVYVAED
jgi:DNA-binding GntR family transcriptional regulator